MKVIFSSPFFVFVCVQARISGSSRLSDVCGIIDDPCVNKENLEVCRGLVEAACEHIVVMESCPLQYACGDETVEAKLPVDLSTMTSSTFGPPDSCVSLYVYADKKCSGKPLHDMSFPTWSYSGSPCYHDATMDHLSVANMYCNFDTGNFHETVYTGSEDCTVPWWNHWDDSWDLTFTTDSCIGGLSLKHCKPGPCDADTNDHVIAKTVEASQM